MYFYILENYPRGDAETCVHPEKGHNVGDAPRCPACGRFVGMLTWLPPYRVVLELYGKQFGDFAFLVVGSDFLVSQRFRDLYAQLGLTGLSGFEPVEVVKVKSRKRKRSPAPPYYRVVVGYGGPAIDQAASGFEWIDPPTCPVCRSGNIMRWKRLLLEEGTWHGEDAFCPRGLSAFMVSERFKDACQQHGITNAFFTPAESAGGDFYPGLRDASELGLPRTT
jgi:hypothetical protein